VCRTQTAQPCVSPAALRCALTGISLPPLPPFPVYRRPLNSLSTGALGAKAPAPTGVRLLPLALTWAVKAYNAAKEQQVGKYLAPGVPDQLFAEFREEWRYEGDKLLAAAGGDSKVALARGSVGEAIYNIT
jgi:hypothetical protein